MTSRPVVLFRVDAGARADVGTGHLARCLLIAEALGDEARAKFAMLAAADLEFGINQVGKLDYPLTRLLPHNYLRDLETCVDRLQPKFCVCDLYEYQVAELKIFRDRGIPTMTFDHIAAEEWSTFWINAIARPSARVGDGPAYAVMRTPARRVKATDEVRRIFLSFGGYDHCGLMRLVMEALSELDVDLVACAASAGPEQTQLTSRDRDQVFYGPPNFHELMESCDAAFVAGGLTVFECLARGIPTAVLGQYPHQLENVKVADQLGAVLNLGLGRDVSQEQVRSAAEKLMNPLIRKSLSENATRLVDGHGLKRVVNLIRQSVRG